VRRSVPFFIRTHPIKRDVCATLSQAGSAELCAAAHYSAVLFDKNKPQSFWRAKLCATRSIPSHWGICAGDPIILWFFLYIARVSC